MKTITRFDPYSKKNVSFNVTDRFVKNRKKGSTFKLIKKDGSVYKSSKKNTEFENQPFTRYKSITAALKAKAQAELAGEKDLIIDIA